MDKLIVQLDDLFQHRSYLLARWNKLFRNSSSDSWGNEPQKRRIDDEIGQNNLDIRDLLNDLLQYPPHFNGHMEKLQKFHAEADYNSSVFIMTKYPDPKGANPEDINLKRVIDIVISAVKEFGRVPRLGSDRKYQDTIWGNTECYLLGCSKGIAIVEDRYKDEFNPNVAMEWGWMRAMGKEVLYLVEETFNNERADAAGFISDKFSWDNPEKQIREAVKNWLADK